MVIDVFVTQLLFNQGCQFGKGLLKWLNFSNHLSSRDVTEEVPLIRRWMEVVASELFSARVAVSPKPSESDPSKVPTDPSRGRYKAARDFGAPYGERLCKLVRKEGRCTVLGIKELSLGCVNPASWLTLATWCEFTQPRAQPYSLSLYSIHKTFSVAVGCGGEERVL